jgi:hypothetical protein
MTNTNTAANTEAQAPAAAAEPMSKMAHSRILFAEIYAPGYKLKMEGAKSQRSEFVKRAMAEFGATKNGAATYFQNLSNEAKGQPLYKYTPKKKTKEGTEQAEGQLTETTNQAGKAADLNNSASEGAIGEFRWTVSNEAGEEVASFPVRKTADEYAKANGLVRGDRNLAAKAE